MAEESKFDFRTLSPEKQQLWRLCRRIMKELRSGSCTDAEVADLMARGDAKAHGYINPDDYLTADMAMKILNVSRVKFFDLIKFYKVKVKTINNRSVGYYRPDIDMILTREIARNNYRYFDKEKRKGKE